MTSVITPEMGDLSTKDEVAALLKVSRRHVDNLTSRGIIPAVKLGRSIRYIRANVLAAVASLEARKEAA